jgi:DNA repair protein RadC
MLFIKDMDGEYRPASKKTVLIEANKLMVYQLQRGASILSAECAKAVMGCKLRDKQCEVFACLFLDSQHRVIEFKEMFTGTINHATVHPREVVKKALQLNAEAVILAHNHPSGYNQPSPQDIALTKTLTEILKVIDVRVLDHLIIGDEVIAFSDLGLMAE